MRLWLTQPPTHERLNRMSLAPPVPPFQLPRLTECRYILPTAVTNPNMPGVHGAQDANELPTCCMSEQQIAPLAPLKSLDETGQD